MIRIQEFCSMEDSPPQNLVMLEPKALLSFVIFLVFVLFILLTALVFFRVRTDTRKYGEAGFRWHGNIKGFYIRVSNCVNSIFHDIGILTQQILITSSLVIKVREVSRNVAKLATRSVDTVMISSHIGRAQGHLEL